MSEPDSAPKHRRIPEIIKDAGGAPKIAEASQGTVKVDAVYKWIENGSIPWPHWPVVMPLASATEAEMLAANMAERRPKAGAAA